MWATHCKWRDTSNAGTASSKSLTVCDLSRAELSSSIIPRYRPSLPHSSLWRGKALRNDRSISRYGHWTTHASLSSIRILRSSAQPACAPHHAIFTPRRHGKSAQSRKVLTEQHPRGQQTSLLDPHNTMKQLTHVSLRARIRRRTVWEPRRQTHKPITWWFVPRRNP